MNSICGTLSNLNSFYAECMEDNIMKVLDNLSKDIDKSVLGGGASGSSPPQGSSPCEVASTSSIRSVLYNPKCKVLDLSSDRWNFSRKAHRDRIIKEVNDKAPAMITFNADGTDKEHMEFIERQCKVQCARGGKYVCHNSISKSSSDNLLMLPNTRKSFHGKITYGKICSMQHGIG